MGQLKIIITVGGVETKVLYVDNKTIMWDKLRAFRDQMTEDDLVKGTEAVVKNDDGSIFTNVVFDRNQKGHIDMLSPENKRIRRGFSTIIIQKFDAKAKDIDPKKYKAFRKKLDAVLDKFDKLIVDSKKEKKSDNQKFKILSKYTKEEIENYLKSISNKQDFYCFPDPRR